MRLAEVRLALEEVAPTHRTARQMLALEQRVQSSTDATEFAKKAIIWLIRQSGQLTRRVSLSASPAVLGEAAEKIQDAAHAMNSCGASTRIDLLFRAMGTEWGLSHHCGGYNA